MASEATKRPDYKAIASRLFDHTVRIGPIIWIGAQDQESPSDDLEDFLDFHDVAELKEIFGDIPDVIIDDMEGCGRTIDGWQFLSDWLFNSDRFGLLIRAEKPVFTFTKAGNVDFSWGHYHTRWLYCESLDEAADKAIAWAEQMEADDKAKSLGKVAS